MLIAIWRILATRALFTEIRAFSHGVTSFIFRLSAQAWLFEMRHYFRLISRALGDIVDIGLS